MTAALQGLTTIFLAISAGCTVGYVLSLLVGPHPDKPNASVNWRERLLESGDGQ